MKFTRTLLGAAACCLLAASQLQADSTAYDINFSDGASPTNPSGSFMYDSSSDTFSDFIVVFDTLSFDLTDAANTPKIAGTAPACLGGATDGAASFALLSGSCSDAEWQGQITSNGEFTILTPTNIPGVGYIALDDRVSSVGINPMFVGDAEAGTFTITAVPEPGQVGVMIAGLLALLCSVRRTRRVTS